MTNLSNVPTLSSPSAAGPSYQDIFRELGGHTTPMWISLWLRSVLSAIGLALNAILVLATFRSSNLRSMCNWLIALEAGCQGIFLCTYIITFFVAILDINWIPLSSCFLLQAFPLFSLLMAFQLILLIGLERLSSVLFPIWSRSCCSRRIHQLVLLISLGCCLFLLFLDQRECAYNQSLVMCQLSDITSRGLFYSVSFARTISLHILVIVVYSGLWATVKIKKSQALQHFSRNILNSLLVLVLIELGGWLPAFFIGKIALLLELKPYQSFVFTSFMGINSIVCASSNAPVLYALSKRYRRAINALFIGQHPIKWAKNATVSQANINARIMPHF